MEKSIVTILVSLGCCIYHMFWVWLGWSLRERISRAVDKAWDKAFKK